MSRNNRDESVERNNANKRLRVVADSRLYSPSTGNGAVLMTFVREACVTSANTFIHQLRIYDSLRVPTALSLPVSLLYESFAGFSWWVVLSAFNNFSLIVITYTVFDPSRISIYEMYSMTGLCSCMKWYSHSRFTVRQAGGVAGLKFHGVLTTSKDEVRRLITWYKSLFKNI